MSRRKTWREKLAFNNGLPKVVAISGKMSTRHLHGTMGNGGALLKLMTVNGSITIHEAGPMPPERMDHPVIVRVPRVKVTLPERP